jgi:hypothetical protein
MPTSSDWEVITIPSYPPAPASIEFSVIDIVALSRSPFTGQQQVQDWQATYMEAKVSLPPLTDARAQPWIAFLFGLKGMAKVFQFTPEFAAAYPASIGDRFWRLKSNQRMWSISEQRVYGISFEIIEAI